MYLNHCLSGKAESKIYNLKVKHQAENKVALNKNDQIVPN